MRLIIDTDTAGDDCFSILLALSDKRVTVEAVTICNGNINFDQQAENALATIERAGFAGRVPVHLGCRRPLIRAPLDAEYVFGKDGMSDAGFARTRQRPETRHAVDTMVERVMASPGEITIIAQAPLTNIAMAVAKEPRFAAAVKHLWVMGGTDNALGNVTPAAEFNFYVDPEAARMVMAAGFTMTICTWTLSLRDSLISEKELDAIAAMDTPLSDFFTKVNSASAMFSRARYGNGSTVHPDTLTCACALNEDLVLGSALCVVDVETEGRLTRGYSSVSDERLPDQEIADPALGRAGKPNARIVRRADRDGFLSMLVAALR